MAKLIGKDGAAAMETDQPGTRDELRALIAEFETAMFVTKDEHGTPRARPMEVLLREGDHALWFVTADWAPKVAEIEHDPMVAAVLYRDRDRAWVSVSGRASLHRDKARLIELWKPAMKGWFTGPEDPTALLVRLDPWHAEYFESPKTKVGRVYEIAKAVLTGAQPEMGPVKHVSRVEINRLSEPRLSEPAGRRSNG
jgi:general stress protein 26